MRWQPQLHAHAAAPNGIPAAPFFVIVEDPGQCTLRPGGVVARLAEVTHPGDSRLCVTQERGPTKLDFMLDVDAQTRYSHGGAFSNFFHSYQQPTAICFIDFVAAFDSVRRESLWRIMALDGVPAKIIAIIKAYYRSTTARVLVRNNPSHPFGILSGVRQGCILSPILFNYAIDWILGSALHEGDSVECTPGHRLSDLDYADDIILLASNFGDLQSMVSRVNEVAQSVGLSINAGKT
ncbi:hypothetical protein SprV_0401667800 [Sparganum proliferum]